MRPLMLPSVLLPFLLGLLVAGCARPESSMTPVEATATLQPAATPIMPEVVSKSTAGQERQRQPEPSPAPAFVPEQFNIILGRPTDHSIAVNILAGKDVEVILEYGLAPNEYSSQIGPYQIQAGLPETIELTDLAADSVYTYRMVINGQPADAHTFHTRRTTGSDFTFTIDADTHYGDPRFDGELFSATLANALQDQPDFHINLGDTFMTEKIKPRSYENAERTFTGLRPYFGVLAADAPLFLVNGNHEGELGWLLAAGKDQEFPIWSTQLRQQYYPNPQPGAFYSGSTSPDEALGEPRNGYYAWTWGDALFIVLDPYWYTDRKPKSGEPDSAWNWTLGRQQYEWLLSTLESSRASYRFVFIHHLVGGSEEGRGGIEFASLYEWGGNNTDGSYGFDQQRPGWGLPIHQLLVANHVSAVFHGHDHVFIRQELDGIIYQEVPQSSNSQPDNTHLADDYGYLHGDVVAGSGYLRLTVSPTGVSVDFVRTSPPRGAIQDQEKVQVAYSYTIK